MGTLKNKKIKIIRKSKFRSAFLFHSGAIWGQQNKFDTSNIFVCLFGSTPPSLSVRPSLLERFLYSPAGRFIDWRGGGGLGWGGGKSWKPDHAKQFDYHFYDANNFCGDEELHIAENVKTGVNFRGGGRWLSGQSGRQVHARQSKTEGKHKRPRATKNSWDHASNTFCLVDEKQKSGRDPAQSLFKSCLRLRALTN